MGFTFRRVIRALWFLLVLVPSLTWAMKPVSVDEQIATINAAFPSSTRIGDKLPLDVDQPEARLVYRNDDVIGYAFETVDVVDVPAYSGKPVNLLVAIDIDGVIRVVRVLEHHEPILLVGIPEQRLFDFASQLRGMKIQDHVVVGGGAGDQEIGIDSVSGATVTVIVVNEVVMRSARKIAGLVGLDGTAATPPNAVASIRSELYQEADWIFLTGDGSIRHRQLSHADVDKAFEDTRAAFKGEGKAHGRAQKLFIDLYYTLLDVPTIGRNLLGSEQFEWLMSELKPGDHAVAVMAKGDYSFKGSGYVRGGIFDRIQVQQQGKTILFRDTDYYRLSDVYLAGMPDFDEMGIFIIRDKYQFDVGSDWQLELVVRRQLGALDSVFTRFLGEYTIPERYIERPAPAVTEEKEALWVSVWRNKAFQITVLSISLLLLFSVLIVQDMLVKHPRFIRIFRLCFLVYTLFFIGWYTLGQLSIVNVFTFAHAAVSDFNWHTFLLDPVMFILWSFVAVTLLLWGRGVFCGWLCPFGALQELINEIGRKLRIRQFELPFALHERLWALKYLILLVLFAISLDSIGTAERYAEIEPFKTAIMLKFQREWGYVFYAVALLIVSLFMHKAYCRYICPLGAALTIPARFRLFDWLKRRKECGSQCQICANECEIQAIHPNGQINANECHWCLDCQVTYHNEFKCPPLIRRYNKRHKMEPGFAPIRIVEEKQ